MAMAPASIMAMATTQANTGRSRKNRDSMASPYFFAVEGALASAGWLPCGCLESKGTALTVMPGRIFKNAFEWKGLHSRMLSRSLEDCGTLTSVLIPWNTCGAYQSAALGVATGEYFIYAVFNWVSPLMSLLVAAVGFKIRKLR